MKQNTAERFLILIQHPEKSRFLVSDQVKNVGLIGAILLDLSLEGTINIEAGKLILKSTETKLSLVHKKVLKQFEKSTKTRKIKTWISRLLKYSTRYQKEILLALERKGYVKIEQRKFLFFNYYKTRLTNTTVREQIINEVRDVIFYAKQIDHDKSMIIGLINACKMYKVIGRDRRELKICKTKLREMIIQANLIFQGVDKVIKEMDAAILAAVVASTVAATSTSN